MRAWFRSEKSFPLRLFLLALLLRLVPVLLTYRLGIGLDDMFQYDMLARSLVAGNGYRWYAQEDLYTIQPYVQMDLSTVDYDPRGVLTSFRPPLYPAFLALIYLLTGADQDRFFTVRLIQAFIGASLVPLTYAIARRLFPDRETASSTTIGRIAAWVVACYPMLVIYPLSLATENLFFLLMLSAVLVLLKACTQPGWYWFALGGVLLGLTALTRSVALAVAGLSVLWVWLALRKWKMAVIVMLALSVVILPWVVRNSLLHGRLSGIETALGYDLYVSYHPESDGTIHFPRSLDLVPILDDAERDRIGIAKTWEFIQEDPARVPYLMVRRLGHFFGLERRAITYFYSNNFFGYQPPLVLITAAILVLLPFVAVSTSACFGAALTGWNTETRFLALFFLGYITPHILVIAEDRFHLTCVPFFAILAARFWVGGWPALYSRWHVSRVGRIAVVLASLAVLLLFLNWGLEIWRDMDKLTLLFSPNGNQTYFPY